MVDKHTGVTLFFFADYSGIILFQDICLTLVLFEYIS